MVYPRRMRRSFCRLDWMGEGGVVGLCCGCDAADLVSEDVEDLLAKTQIYHQTAVAASAV